MFAIQRSNIRYAYTIQKLILRSGREPLTVGGGRGERREVEGKGEGTGEREDVPKKER